MGKRSDAPDYTGAAQATAAGNKEAVMYQTAANRANQITPWGNQTWHGMPGSAGYGQETTLSPNQQAIFDNQEQIQDQRQQAALGLGDRMRQEMQRPEDFYNNLPDVAGTPDVPTYGEGLTGFGQNGQQMQLQNNGGGLGQFGQGGQQMELQNYGGGLGQFGQGGQQMLVQDTQGSQYDPRFAQQAFDRQLSLIQPTHADQQERQEVALRNQGLTPGTQAYDTALGNLRMQQGEELNALSADAVDRGRAEQQSEFSRGIQAGGQRFDQEQARFTAQMDQAALQDKQRAQQTDEQLGFGGQRFDEQSQLFGAQMDQAALQDKQRAQQTDEQLSFGDQRFNQETQIFGSQQDRADMADRQRAQQVVEQLGFGGQAFTQQMQQQDQQNALRQRAIAEQQGREVSALNLQNASTSGQQVGMPQMPGYNTADRWQGPDYLGAANMQGQFDNDQYATSMGPVNAAIGAGGSFLQGGFGGSAVPAPGYPTR